MKYLYLVRSKSFPKGVFKMFVTEDDEEKVMNIHTQVYKDITMKCCKLENDKSVKGVMSTLKVYKEDIDYFYQCDVDITEEGLKEFLEDITDIIDRLNNCTDKVLYDKKKTIDDAKNIMNNINEIEYKDKENKEQEKDEEKKAQEIYKWQVENLDDPQKIFESHKIKALTIKRLGFKNENILTDYTEKEIEGITYNRWKELYEDDMKHKINPGVKMGGECTDMAEAFPSCSKCRRKKEKKEEPLSKIIEKFEKDMEGKKYNKDLLEIIKRNPKATKKEFYTLFGLTDSEEKEQRSKIPLRPPSDLFTSDYERNIILNSMKKTIDSDSELEFTDTIEHSVSNLTKVIGKKSADVNLKLAEERADLNNVNKMDYNQLLEHTEKYKDVIDKDFLPYTLSNDIYNKPKYIKYFSYDKFNNYESVNGNSIDDFLTECEFEGVIGEDSDDSNEFDDDKYIFITLIQSKLFGGYMYIEGKSVKEIVNKEYMREILLETEMYLPIGTMNGGIVRELLIKKLDKCEKLNESSFTTIVTNVQAFINDDTGEELVVLGPDDMEIRKKRMVSKYINKMCIRSEGSKVYSKELFENFMEYLTQNRQTMKIYFNKNNFTPLVRLNNYETKRDRNGIYWKNMKLVKTHSTLYSYGRPPPTEIDRHNPPIPYTLPTGTIGGLRNANMQLRRETIISPPLEN